MYMPVVKGVAAASCAAHAVVLQLPLEGVLCGGGLAAVLKRPAGHHPEWLVGPHNRDFFISFEEVWPVTFILAVLYIPMLLLCQFCIVYNPF